MKDGKLRFGLIGTGIWARDIHSVAAAGSDAVHFTSVLGRDRVAVARLAETHGVAAYTELGEFLGSVDIVGMALPPAIQPGFALAAAAAGKHLLLEKPIAISLDDATRIATECDKRGLTSIVFFTQLFIPRVQAWIDDAVQVGGWIGGRVDGFSSVLVDPKNPYYRTDWRKQAGALWDIGPHAVALLVRVLGQVKLVAASSGPGDFTALTLTHESGAVASIHIAMDLIAPVAGETAVFGSAGKRVLPPSPDWATESRDAYRNALATLAAAASGHGGSHPDARFAAHVTAVLAAAERSMVSGQRVVPS